MDIQKQIQVGEQKLKRLDKKLGALIKKQPPVIRSPHCNYFFALARSIVGQQVSVAAALAIFTRLEKASGIDPVKIVKLSEAECREIGLSQQKASYLHDLAQHFVGDPKVFNHLENLNDEEIIQELTAIKGIGRWTAQMFLMSTLLRLDVFAPDDIGLQRAMKTLYGWELVPTKAKLELIAETWRPYRTIACWHLWYSLQND